MSATKQITVRLSEDLVDWLDAHVDDDYPSRAALITQALKRAKRRQASRQNLAQFLAVEAAGPTAEDLEQEQWMATREYPDDDDEPAAAAPARRFLISPDSTIGHFTSVPTIDDVVVTDDDGNEQRLIDWVGSRDAVALVFKLRALGLAWAPPRAVVVQLAEQLADRLQDKENTAAAEHRVDV